MTDALPIYPSDEWQQIFMDKIVSNIFMWKDDYYNKNETVDDATYDLWWRNLLFMEKKYPHLVRANSPTDMVGSEVALTLAEMSM